MRSKASWLRLLLKGFCPILVNNFLLCTPQEPENLWHPSWATPRHDGNIRIILTEKANLAVGRPAIGGLLRKPSRFKFTNPAWTHRPIQRCYEPGQICGHKEALLEWKVKNWSKNGAPHQQPKVQLVHFGSKAWQHSGQSASLSVVTQVHASISDRWNPDS